MNKPPLPLPVNSEGDMCCPKCAYPEHLAQRWKYCAVGSCPIQFAKNRGIPLTADFDWNVDDAVEEFS